MSFITSLSVIWVKLHIFKMALRVAVLTLFVVSQANSLLHNESPQRSDHDLPEIKEGDPCELHKVYSMGCNTCRCEAGNHLQCTKMACLPDDGLDKIKHKELKGDPKKEEKQDKELKTSKFPELPAGECVPGKLYQKECYGCYCQHDKVVACSKKKNVCEPGIPPFAPEDFKPALTKPEFESLPTLPNMGTRCEPGRTYGVHCNTCLCLWNRSLFCDQLLCLSHDDMLRIEAKQKTGLQCQDRETPPTSDCIKCSCNNGTTKCEADYDCQPPNEFLRQLHGTLKKVKPTLTLNLEKQDKCLPDAVYKNNCNKCYCQADGTLRCTQKYCLNYVETIKLKKQRLLLEKQARQ